uniref:VRK serine/threonine kinase 3 n=1 Tax=Falco tinnunculus TaxID=100819 RepID=A0A8C4VCR1_FALTI
AAPPGPPASPGPARRGCAHACAAAGPWRAAGGGAEGGGARARSSGARARPATSRGGGGSGTGAAGAGRRGPAGADPVPAVPAGGAGAARGAAAAWSPPSASARPAAGGCPRSLGRSRPRRSSRPRPHRRRRPGARRPPPRRGPAPARPAKRGRGRRCRCRPGRCWRTGAAGSGGWAASWSRAAAGCCTKDVKDGKIYNEQNFFQRAAKAGTVEKWKKWHSVPLLGIPSCVGFGLHADSYRFLVFSDLGRTLQSVLNDGLHLLKEKAAFQIVVRLLDCLEYIHENEYVHGDITAENIYLNPADLTQVTLAGYCFAFRYCPGGKHVAHREGSRTPHEGTMEFISLDSHKGAGPSRRSDLESLGYCLLKWLCGFLPWSDELDKVETVVEKKEKYRADVKCLLQLCFRQRSIPDALQSYLQQVMALGYEEKPDYEALRQLFKKPLEKMKASAYDSVDIKMVP